MLLPPVEFIFGRANMLAMLPLSGISRELEGIKGEQKYVFVFRIRRA